MKRIFLTSSMLLLGNFDFLNEIEEKTFYLCDEMIDKLDTDLRKIAVSDPILYKKIQYAFSFIYKNRSHFIIVNHDDFEKMLYNDEVTIFTTDKIQYLRLSAQNTATIHLYKPSTEKRMTVFADNEKNWNYVNSIDFKCTNPFNLKINDYFLLGKEKLYKVKSDYEYIPVYPQSLKSSMFGDIKPKKTENGMIDWEQVAAIDSLNHNQVTMLRGKSGSGKSHLALAALFSKLEKHEISKIYIFCNPIATRDSAKLGLYPGTKDEKLLDSQIGNFLDGKIGDREYVLQLITKGKLILLPMSDIRGFDSNGKKAGIYITEAQNLTIDLIQLALERVGDDCICIIDGDDTRQVDLDIYSDLNNGMRRVSQVYTGSDFYGEITLHNVYRSRVAKLAAKLKEDI